MGGVKGFDCRPFRLKRKALLFLPFLLWFLKIVFSEKTKFQGNLPIKHFFRSGNFYLWSKKKALMGFFLLKALLSNYVDGNFLFYLFM